MTVSKTFNFSEVSVRNWCRQAGDSNQLHLSSDGGDNDLVDEPIVPGMMLLDKVSGLVSQWAETKDGSVVLTGIEDVAFRKPVEFDTDVGIALLDEEPIDGSKDVRLPFEVTDTIGGVPAVDGAVTVRIV